MTLHFPLALKALTMISLLSTSNFFWSSPWTFAAPANPTRLISRALRTLDAMYLDVTCYQLVVSAEKDARGTRETHLDCNEKHGEITSSSLPKRALLRKQMSRQGDQVGCWGFQLGRRVWGWHFVFFKVFVLRTKGEMYDTTVSVSIFWITESRQLGRLISTNGLRIGVKPRLECFDVTFSSGALFFWTFRLTYVAGYRYGVYVVWLYSKYSVW